MRVVFQLFARQPQAGRCKTRLIPALGAKRAARWHRQQLRRLLSLLDGLDGGFGDGFGNRAALQLWYTPQGAWAMRHRLGLDCCAEYDLRAQRGADLGQRMGFAVRTGLAEFDAVVLIGTDAPGLDAGYVSEALAVLESGAQTVFGPTQDGGYVLLGLRSWQPGLFRAIAWGQSSVLARSLRRQPSSTLLRPLLDVDDRVDWLLFKRLSRLGRC